MLRAAAIIGARARGHAAASVARASTLCWKSSRRTRPGHGCGVAGSHAAWVAAWDGPTRSVTWLLAGYGCGAGDGLMESSARETESSGGEQVKEEDDAEISTEKETASWLLFPATADQRVPWGRPPVQDHAGTAVSSRVR